jgi:uncharacterized membrane protein YgaE (UPF0421/DUF939 family)
MRRSKMEDQAMSFIRNGNALYTRRGLCGVVFSALLAFALFSPGMATAQELKQIKLTEKHMKSFLAAYQAMSKLSEGENPDKPDPKVTAQLEATAKKHGFASLDEYDDVSGNISLVMSGIDPKTKKFTEPPEAIKQQIAELKADKSISEADKKQELDDLNDQLKTAQPVKFKENVALVTKYYDQITAVMQA